ncbi:MAG: succinate dehydrogenase [Geminicoccaceae bacterium]
MEFRLYLLQRLSALIMAPLVIGHIAVMIYAVQGGLSAEEILGRTQGSLFWGAFYGLFVLAVATHAAIGLRNIAQEWLGFEGAALDAVTCLVGLGVLVLGGRAVFAVLAS